MKTYKVLFYYTETGVALIKAKSDYQAKRQVELELADTGLDKLKYNCKNREYEVLESEEE